MRPKRCRNLWQKKKRCTVQDENNNCRGPFPSGMYVKVGSCVEGASSSLRASRSGQCLWLPGELKYTELYTFLILFASVSSKAADSLTSLAKRCFFLLGQTHIHQFTNTSGIKKKERYRLMKCTR